VNKSSRKGVIAFKKQRLKGAGDNQWSLITRQQKEVFRQPVIKG